MRSRRQGSLAAACVLAACGALVAPTRALADCGVGADGAARPRLQLSWGFDVPFLATLAGTWGVTEGMKQSLAPSAPAWTARNPLDEGVRGLSRSSSPKSAATLSDLVAFGLLPASTLGMSLGAVGMGGGCPLEAVEDVVVMGESVALAAVINQTTKFLSARERPYARDEAGADRDGNLSFFSGHATMAFSLATSAGVIASLKGERSAPVVWATGLTLALTTAYARVAADKHYFSDVLVGALVGTTVGIAVPLFHRPPSKGRRPHVEDGSRPKLRGIMGAPLPGGGTLGLHGTL
jgi:hypothetical protein